MSTEDIETGHCPLVITGESLQQLGTALPTVRFRFSHNTPLSSTSAPSLLAALDRSTTLTDAVSTLSSPTVLIGFPGTALLSASKPSTSPEAETPFATSSVS